MTHQHHFQHAGRRRQLVKHPARVADFRAGRIDAAGLAATAWYLRTTVAGRRRLLSLRTADTAEAVRRAKLRLRLADRDQLAEALEAAEVGPAVTLGTLANRWRSAGCPHDHGAPRSPRQQSNLLPFLDRALRWWGGRPATAVSRRMLHEYRETRNGSTRSVDLELTALSSLCRWAVAVELIPANPFAERPRFHRPEAVRHCHAKMPPSDEALHAILRVFFIHPDPAWVVTGGHLACCALTGLRPGEPGALVRKLEAADGGRHQPGQLYEVRSDPDGPPQAKLAVARLKNGQNRAVAVHPALADFLAHWSAWLDAHLPHTRHWFPHPSLPSSPLVPPGATGGSRLQSRYRTAVRRAGLPDGLTPHGLRAYYVRVRRAQGADDLTISIELGQSGGSGLVRRVYGDPADVLGDGAFDWLPDDPGAIAWRTLTPDFRPD